ncbi:LysR family transcriptional regulator [Gordonia terrae]|uniref:LysR family transcriptional regulator n=1 Tax=Gordonia terrae TaxID=2055 RepID=UPI003F6D3021
MKDSALARVDLNLLVSLQALLSTKSVSKAADAVGLTQPAMSNALKRLRRLLDDDLLVRQAGGYALTPRARDLYAPLDQALALLNHEVVWPEEFDPATSIREFTIVATNAAAGVFLPPLTRRLQLLDASMSLRHLRLDGDIDEMIDHHDLDVLLVPDGVRTSHPRERFFDESWVLVCSRGHGVSDDPLDVHELAKHSFAVFDAGGIRTLGDLAIAAALPTHKVVARTDDFLLLMALITETDLIGVVQEPIARRFSNRDLVQILPSPVALPPLRIDLVWPPGSTSDLGRAWLREQLHEIARATPET